MKSVNKPVRKKDAMALVTGQPVYLDDLPTFRDALIIKLLRSPHAHANILSVDTSTAMKVPGIEAIYTYEDVPKERFTIAGQTFPEPSPYDRLILDRHLRCVGDPVAIVAGTSEKAVNRALKMIKVKYEVLPALLDFSESLNSPILVHPEEDWKIEGDPGADHMRNLCSHGEDKKGDVDAVLEDCDVTVDHIYHTRANQQAMMETFRTGCFIDAYGRLNIVSSTQIVFHVRRIISHALGIPKSKIRVSKPRIGGGFGAKQTAVCEVYPAFVTWMTKKPSKIIYSREESQIISSPRHEMELHVRVGADKDGHIRAIDVHTLSNTGAYGEHGTTTVGLSGHKSIPLYGNLDAFRFTYDVVYTNTMAAGAYRGYGATQGIFAVESAVNELAQKLEMDPTEIREMNMLKEGQVMEAYYGETCTSCALDRCMTRAKEMIGWDEKPMSRVLPNGKIRSLGVAMAMQGSCISGVDVGSATIKIDEDGGYNLIIAAADMGTGCDTILAQIAAEVLECSVDDIAVLGADTDVSPYDSGSYASSTTYITGKATEMAALKLRDQMIAEAASMMNCPEEEITFDGYTFTCGTTGKTMTRQELSTRTMCGYCGSMETTVSHSSPISPPPYMVGMVEIELDPETGEVMPLDYVAVVDCGTPINPNLARIQTEGGILQGIGMCLYEEVQYTKRGQMINNSLMQYKIPSRQDLGHIRVDFESSYEATGPFGAKSVGEIVIDTPSPAIAHAIANATGIWFRELPITQEKIAMALANKKQDNSK